MKVFRIIYSVYAILVFFILMLGFGLFILVPSFFPPKGIKLSYRVIRLWARMWSMLVGIKFRCHGLEHVSLEQPYIYIFNHRSFLDAPAIPMSIPQEIKALGKKEIRNIPLFGWVISQYAVWVDRKNIRSREASLGRLVQFLQAGYSIVVAPEGTRNDTKEALLPFYNGAFRLAIETQTPVMCMAIINAAQIMPKKKLSLWPGTVDIYFSAPILPPANMGEEAVLNFKERCFNRLEAMILTHE
ncbi:lysophospholipid acyltransferase family protein [Lunatibacter salilacus]|uniref:lysophospholipid acyltransferase family protein n=1 Tax=Lunatibacter salilacus TaxID=2483804 RepID=UPI00131DA186|nr:lysophospholipid acyltransferase family protein [Lunatibacter salilacus]